MSGSTTMSMSGGVQVKGQSTSTSMMSGASAPSQAAPQSSPQTNDSAVVLVVPATPVIRPQTGGIPVPALNLPSSSSASGSSLITSSPYAQNEGTAFAKGTSMWQSTAAVAPKNTSPTSLITESPFTMNEGKTFAVGTSLWQLSVNPQANASLWSQATAANSKKACSQRSSSPLSMRPMSAPLSAQNIVTASSLVTNESTAFDASTSLWQSNASATSSDASPGKPSLITSSPYVHNENVSFPKGTSLWQPKK